MTALSPVVEHSSHAAHNGTVVYCTRTVLRFEKGLATGLTMKDEEREQWQESCLRFFSRLQHLDVNSWGTLLKRTPPSHTKHGTSPARLQL